MIFRGLNKGQKKEIYFCNKAKLFSSFLLIRVHWLISSYNYSIKHLQTLTNWKQVSRSNQWAGSPCIGTPSMRMRNLQTKTAIGSVGNSWQEIDRGVYKATLLSGTAFLRINSSFPALLQFASPVSGIVWGYSKCSKEKNVRTYHFRAVISQMYSVHVAARRHHLPVPPFCIIARTWGFVSTQC